MRTLYIISFLLIGISSTKAASLGCREDLAECNAKLQASPDDTNWLLARAKAYSCEKKPFDAIHDCDRILALNPRHSEALMFRAKLKKGEGLDKDALVDYERIIEFEPEHFEARLEKARLEYYFGFYDLALNDFKVCLNINPSADLFYQTGRMELKLGLNREAISHLSMAIRLEKNQAAYYTNRAEAYYFQAQYDLTIKDLTQALSIDSTQLWPLLRKGNAEHQAGLYNDAINSYSALIAHRPDSASVYADRARSYVSLNKYDLALADMKECLRLNPNDLDALEYRAGLFEKAQKWAEAELDYSAYLERNPGNFLVYQKRAEVRMTLKKYAEAVADLDKVIEFKPKHGEAYFNRGVVKLSLEKQQDACQDFDASLKLGYAESAAYLKACD
jgi:tetratricopeptide (TPR) repeat protein